MSNITVSDRLTGSEALDRIQSLKKAGGTIYEIEVIPLIAGALQQITIYTSEDGTTGEEIEECLSFVNEVISSHSIDKIRFEITSKL